MGLGYFQMHVSQVMIILAIPQITIPMMTDLQCIPAGCRSIAAGLVVFPMTQHDDAPRMIAILIEADPIATTKGEITTATQMPKGMGTMFIVRISHRTGAYLSETPPPVGGRNMTQPRLTTS